MSFRILRFLTAGESHGPMLVGILDGIPAGVSLQLERIDAQMRRRMGGYGRGKRMKIEQDRARFVAGVRHGETLGSPIAYLIENRDWANWEDVMAVWPPEEQGSTESDDGEAGDGGGAVAESGDTPSPAANRRRITRPRPGHADLAGGLKYDRSDLRDILERASARETAARVAAGAVCRQLLERLDVDIASHVVQIGDARFEPERLVEFDVIRERADDSPVRCVDDEATEAMMAAIDDAHDELDTLGGAFEVVARGVPPGLGSHVQWDRKLDGRLAQAMASIHAQKGVEIGAAVWEAGQPGSRVHDPIHYDPERGYVRPTLNSGGTEGGITIGGELRVSVYMKPLSTLRQPLPSVDIVTREPVEAVVQRSDVCAVPAAAVIGEAMMALVLTDACLEKFGGDSLREMRRNQLAFLEQVRDWPTGRRD